MLLEICISFRKDIIPCRFYNGFRRNNLVKVGLVLQFWGENFLLSLIQEKMKFYNNILFQSRLHYVNVEFWTSSRKTETQICAVFLEYLHFKSEIQKILDGSIEKHFSVVRHYSRLDMLEIVGLDPFLVTCFFCSQYFSVFWKKFDYFQVRLDSMHWKNFSSIGLFESKINLRGVFHRTIFLFFFQIKYP